MCSKYASVKHLWMTASCSCRLLLHRNTSFGSDVHLVKNDLPHVLQQSTLSTQFVDLEQELALYSSSLYLFIEVKLKINKSKHAMSGDYTGI